MATVEHCLYCFESLAAELENRDALSLEDVQKSYGAYLAALSSQADDDNLPKKSPALRRLAVAATSSASSSSPSLDSSSGSSTTSLLSADTAATSIPASPVPGSKATTATKVTDPTACYPLFVTWDKLHAGGPDYHLRGCIGTFSADAPLDTTLSEYALVSALHDTRFARVAARELPLLRCSVTLLTDFEPCADVDDWVLGEHGIRISFTLDSSARRLGATYLPQVPPEQGWDRDETMESLMRKAGWGGGGGRRGAGAGSWREVAARGGMRVERYRGDKEEVEWDEFKAWRDWVKENWAEEA